MNAAIRSPIRQSPSRLRVRCSRPPIQSTEQARSDSGHGSVTSKAKRMNQPDWRDFALEEGMLAKRPRTRAGSSSGFPPTETRAFNTGNASPTSPAAEIAIDQGLCTTGGHLDSSPATGRRDSWASSGIACADRGDKRDFQLPNGAAAEQCGDRQSDLILVWSEEQAEHPRRGPNQVTLARRQRESRSWDRTFSSSPDSSREPAARATGPEHDAIGDSRIAPRACRSDPGRRAADRRSRQRSHGAHRPGRDPVERRRSHKARSRLCEQALAITRELGDTARESDVVGNLGMAMLAVRQPERARELFEQELAHARATTDRFAEKVALERLGIAVMEPARLQRLPRVS